MRRIILALAIVLTVGALAAGRPARAADLPLFDAHIHFSHDAHAALPAGEAASRLRRAGLAGALVSSSDDAGTQALLAAAPDLVHPSLRPYRKRGELTSWLRDPGNIAYVEGLLGRHRYVAIGEFHVHGADADLPNVRRLVELARDHKLFLIAHSDADAVERLFRHDPQARVLWAHAGFERPDTVRAAMRRHKALWADLSFRYEVARGDTVSPDWLAVFSEFPDRFMVGTDTYTPERWSEVESHAAWARRWLSTLPPDLGAAIAHRNAEGLVRGIAGGR
ncbi:amidohydrolase 2 [Paramagnetospirillum caucaseum]|uniref:Amidohydrolase 2 n=1 Tax=Paramagnetospirillum caucaseum TaxID=1244869 RepID=M2YF72_9PROT|nr:amidohydrolase family protein [Paramagnetospirillum caucaseum]EME71591.1 amidohydrolase 2 [Paramagnetospirillum caucaseum]